MNIQKETPLQKAQRVMREKREAGETIERLNPIEKANRNIKSLRLAINGKCWDCTCGQRNEIINCEITSCTLYPVRPYQIKGA